MVEVTLLSYEKDGAASLWDDSVVPSFSRVTLGGRTRSAKKLGSE